jgi:hypothetical protein
MLYPMQLLRRSRWQIRRDEQCQLVSTNANQTYQCLSLSDFPYNNIEVDFKTKPVRHPTRSNQPTAEAEWDTDPVSSVPCRCCVTANRCVWLMKKLDSSVFCVDDDVCGGKRSCIKADAVAYSKLQKETHSPAYRPNHRSKGTELELRIASRRH